MSLLPSLQKYFLFWAAKRSPRAAQVILRHRTIYVLPSRQGLALLLVVAVIWLLGTNYQNNLILALCFFLISVMLVSMIHAFKNMLGLTFSSAATQSAELGESAPFAVAINSRYHTAHHAILLAVADGESVQANLLPGLSTQVMLSLPSKHRGWLSLPRITVKSYFPFGLVRAWAYVELQHRALIFPQAIASAQPPLAVGQGEEGDFSTLHRGEEFQGFQTYQPGSSLSHIAWKQYARGAGLHLKDYRALHSRQYWLDWQSSYSGDTELALSHLCYWVNHYAQNNQEFGLLLPGASVAMGTGDVHRLQALTALALFGWVEEA